MGTHGVTGDYRRVYHFGGRQIGFTRNYDGARSRDDRGTDKILYEIGEDSYVVFVKEWSRWQGESDFSRFYSENPESQKATIISGRQVADLFPDLTNEAGLEFPIELDLSARHLPKEDM